MIQKALFSAFFLSFFFCTSSSLLAMDDEQEEREEQHGTFSLVATNTYIGETPINGGALRVGAPSSSSGVSMVVDDRSAAEGLPSGVPVRNEFVFEYGGHSVDLPADDPRRIDNGSGVMATTFSVGVMPPFFGFAAQMGEPASAAASSSAVAAAPIGLERATRAPSSAQTSTPGAWISASDSSWQPYRGGQGLLRSFVKPRPQ